MESKIIQFTNWSGQYKSTPGVYVIPETVEDLQLIIRDKEHYPSPIIAIGSGHSNSGCNVVPSGTAVYMKKFHYIHEPTGNDVTVGAGMELIEVHRYLAERNLQLPFTPEIGNATIGSLACCCLKDAALGQSSGIATGMVKEIKYIDADGNKKSMQRGDAAWYLMMSSHGLFGVIYEATLDIIPMTLVIQNYVSCNAADADFEKIYTHTLSSNDGVFGLINATTGQMIFETRNRSSKNDKPGIIENIYNKVDASIFKYFNPILGVIESNRYARWVRKLAMAGFGLMKISFPKGRRTFKNLKPIDYSYHYRYRWDFHFWAFPVSQFAKIILPSFLKFLSDYKLDHPSFDERGLMACYRLRVENKAILSPTYSEDRMTLDPVRPVTKDLGLMKEWDDFCNAYNDWASDHGGKCTFNQTKVLSKSQVEKAFGTQWTTFKNERMVVDPEDRFLSNYFRKLMYGND